MKCLILAAGYATRLYPLTQHTPKSLLPVAGRPVIDYIVDQVQRAADIDVIYIVTNARFYEPFKAWLARASLTKHVELLQDGSTNESNRLGAIGDIRFALKSARIEEDLLVLAGDNIFEFSLPRFVAFFREKGASAAITLRLEKDIEKLRRAGVAVIDPQCRVTSFEEKPQSPKSCYASPAFYLYGRKALPLIHHYLDEGNNRDAPGNLVAWLHTRLPVYAFVFEEMRYDIGNLETYREVDRIYTERIRVPGRAPPGRV